jgi:hypothetical protein
VDGRALVEIYRFVNGEVPRALDLAALQGWAPLSLRRL